MVIAVRPDVDAVGAKRGSRRRGGCFASYIPRDYAYKLGLKASCTGAVVNTVSLGWRVIPVIRRPKVRSEETAQTHISPAARIGVHTVI
jgi:hypothetical protein